MKISLSCLCRSVLGLAAASAAAGAWAQTSSASTVVITGAREPLDASRLTADVVVIDRSVIETRLADSLADLLRREAGVQLSRSGGPGQNSGALLRGAASVNTVVLVDGVRVGSGTLGYAQLDGLGLAQIERIEVLRGPGSALYGADAVGGVVQVFTRQGTAGWQAEVFGALASQRSSEASAALRGRQGAWDGALSVGHERSDGVSAVRPGDAFGLYNPDRDGFELRSAQARLGFTPVQGHRIGASWLSSRLNAQYDSAEYLPPSYAADPGADFRNRLATDVAALDWRGRWAAGLSTELRVSRSEDELHSGGAWVDRYRTVRDNVLAQVAVPLGAFGRAVLARDESRERVASTAFFQDERRRSRATILAWDGTAGAWSWQADARHDRRSDVGPVSTGRLGAAWQATPRLKLRALVGTTFRAPSFNELYYPGYGVTGLRPERGRSAEMGLDWRVGAHHLSATVYRNRVRDLIGYEGDPTRCPASAAYAYGCAANLDRARLSGLTVSAAHQFGDLGLRGQLDLVDAKDQATGQRLPRRAAHQATVAADWTRGPWVFGAEIMSLGARPDFGATLPAEVTLNLSALWRWSGGWSLEARALNVTDTDIQPARDYQGLGRQFWLSLRWQGKV